MGDLCMEIANELGPSLVQTLIPDLYTETGMEAPRVHEFDQSTKKQKKNRSVVDQLRGAMTQR